MPPRPASSATERDPLTTSPIRLEPHALEFLQRFLSTPAPSGFERAAADVFEEYASGFAETSRDAIGNCYARRGTGDGPRLALCGHLDEIGVVVSRIDPGGFLRFVTVGSWDPAVLVGQRVIVRGVDGPVEGVVGRPGIHLLRAGGQESVAPRVNDLWIDIAVDSAEAAAELVTVGAPAVLAGEPRFVRDHVISRSLDNRLGTFVVLETLRALPADIAGDIVVVATVQEEIGGAGALAAAPALRADAAIVVDLSPTSDTPVGHPVHQLVLGGGPGLNLGSSNDEALVGRLQSSARSRNITCQMRALAQRTSTDADRFLRSGAGTPCALVSLPSRYAHTPNELVALSDVRRTIELLVGWVVDTCQS